MTSRLPPLPAAVLPTAALRAARRRHGFTLVELMIAMTVALLLSAMAYPAYQAQVAKGRRVDGQQALMAVAQRLERHYTERGSYVGATLGPGGLYPAVSGGGLYALAITELGDQRFRIAATPLGAQATDACGTLVYDQLGESSVSGGTRLAAKQCW